MDADAVENAPNHPNDPAVTLAEQHFSRVFGGTAGISKLPVPSLASGKDGEAKICFEASEAAGWTQQPCFYAVRKKILPVLQPHWKTSTPIQLPVTVPKLTHVANTPPSSSCHLLACTDRCEPPGLLKWLMAGFFISSRSGAAACSLCCERLMQAAGSDRRACASACHQIWADRWGPVLTLLSFAALYPAGAHSPVRSPYACRFWPMPRAHGEFGWGYFPVSAAVVINIPWGPDQSWIPPLLCRASTWKTGLQSS